MVKVGMREHDCRGYYRTQAAEPIHSAIDHETGVAFTNEQTAVTLVPARVELDLSARAEKRQLHGGRSRFIARPVSRDRKKFA